MGVMVRYTTYDEGYGRIHHIRLWVTMRVMVRYTTHDEGYGRIHHICLWVTMRIMVGYTTYAASEQDKAPGHTYVYLGIPSMSRMA